MQALETAAQRAVISRLIAIRDPLPEIESLQFIQTDMVAAINVGCCTPISYYPASQDDGEPAGMTRIPR